VLESNKTLHRSWFGQCWTRHAASDAMWRIYSPESDGVRIRSTPQKLMESLDSAYGASPRFIGRVQYMPTKRLTQFAKALSLKNSVGAAQTLLVKRPAFRHEREVRLLVRRADEKSDRLRCPIDPHDLLDQIMVDPRLEATKARSLQEQIRRRTDFQGSVLRSLLYAPSPPLA